MKRSLRTGIFGLVCFSLGVAVVMAIQSHHFKKSVDQGLLTGSAAAQPPPALQNQPQGDSDEGDDPVQQMQDQMRKQMQTMENQMQSQLGAQMGAMNSGMLNSGMFRIGHHFGGFSINRDAQATEIKRREDKDFVYYDIALKNLDREKLKVRVAQGQINISGQLENKSQAQGRGSYFTSSFQRSFPVPDDVDSGKVQMQQSGDLLTLKFPKLSANS